VVIISVRFCGVVALRHAIRSRTLAYILVIIILSLIVRSQGLELRLRIEAADKVLLKMLLTMRALDPRKRTRP